jgi:hypothetical protein
MKAMRKKWILSLYGPKYIARIFMNAENIDSTCLETIDMSRHFNETVAYCRSRLKTTNTPCK